MAALVIGAVAVAGLLVLLMRLRSSRRDSRTVKAHHHVLARLQHAADAPSQPGGAAPHVRVVPASPPAGGAEEVAVVAPAPAPAAAPSPQLRRPAQPPIRASLAADRAPSTPIRVPAAGVPAATAPGGRAKSGANSGAKSRPNRALAAAGRHRRLVGAAAAGALAAAGVGAGAGFGSGGHRPQHQAAPTVPAHPSATVPVRAPATTVARSLATPTSAGPSGATYVVSSTPVDLTLAASGRCWVELRSGSAAGPIIFQGLVVPGATHAFSNQAGLWLRVGYPPGVSVLLDGSPLRLPAVSSPYDLSVQYA